jgi:hypothetical protein
VTTRTIPMVVALVCVAAACTGATTTTPTTTPDGTPGKTLPATVTVGHATFDVFCTPVAEALIDIELPHAAEPKIRAVTGLWDRQAIAVVANDPKGCGVWALGLARGLSEEAATEIRAEVAEGVTDFGVTASPVPREP